MNVYAESRTTRSVPSPSPVVEKKVQPSLELLKPNDRLEPEIEKTWSNSATRLFPSCRLKAKAAPGTQALTGQRRAKQERKFVYAVSSLLLGPAIALS